MRTGYILPVAVYVLFAKLIHRTVTNLFKRLGGFDFFLIVAFLGCIFDSSRFQLIVDKNSKDYSCKTLLEYPQYA